MAAIRQIEAGRVDADLGGGIVKQRVARRGQGKSGGYRTIIAYRSGDLAVFLFGFAKSDLDNISNKDIEDLRRAAQGFLNGTAEAMTRAITEKEVIEVQNGDDKS